MSEKKLLSFFSSGKGDSRLDEPKKFSLDEILESEDKSKLISFPTDLVSLPSDTFIPGQTKVIPIQELKEVNTKEDLLDMIFVVCDCYLDKNREDLIVVRRGEEERTFLPEDLLIIENKKKDSC